MKQVSGLINQRVRLATYSNEDDGSGGNTYIEVIFWETSATVIQLKANRALESNQEKLKPVFKFEVRFRDDKVIIEDMIVKWRGKDFKIISVEPDFVFKQKIIFTAISNSVPER